MILVLMDELYPRSSLYADYPELARRQDVRVGKTMMAFVGFGRGHSYLLYKGHSDSRDQKMFMNRAELFNWTRYERSIGDVDIQNNQG